MPCRQEAGALTTLLAQSGVRIVGIAYKGQAGEHRRFLGQEGDPYQAVGADETGRTGDRPRRLRVPETYVVKGDGTIAHKIVGPLDEANIKAELMPAIDAAQKPGR